MENGFRKLKAEEIECRVAQVTSTGSLMLLLYKDARCDQKLLDEQFGVFGWQRTHQLIGDRLYCTVSVRNPDTGEWISKQDVGTESYTEKEKGQASDSFKRACFNLGIGRELYTAPTIWISKTGYTEAKNGKGGTYDRFSVKSISYDSEGNINQLTIWNDNLKKEVFSWGTGTKSREESPEDKKANQKMVDSVDKVLLPTEDNKVTDAQIERLKAELKRTGKTLEGDVSLEDMSQAKVIATINVLMKLPDEGK